MGKYGLLGEKLGHSYSPEIHALLKGYEYKLYEVPNEDVGRFLNETDLSGMNVTIPYKNGDGLLRESFRHRKTHGGGKYPR